MSQKKTFAETKFHKKTPHNEMRAIGMQVNNLKGANGKALVSAFPLRK
jgi:hypothetical protein